MRRRSWRAEGDEDEMEESQRPRQREEEREEGERKREQGSECLGSSLQMFHCLHHTGIQNLLVVWT